MPILLRKPVVHKHSRENIFIWFSENFVLSDLVSLSINSVLLWTRGQLPKKAFISTSDTEKLIMQYPDLSDELQQYFFKVNFDDIETLYIEAPIAFTGREV